MLTWFFLNIMLMASDVLPVYIFNINSNAEDWQVVDDTVMGGQSQGRFEISDDGYGIFHGDVSLKNNGGFSSLRYSPDKMQIEGYTKIELKIRGDGKRYQFRVKSNAYDRHAYINYFETTGSWQTVTIKMSEMYPTFRGMKLNMPNYPGKQLGELAFLISNKREEHFRLEISQINLLK